MADEIVVKVGGSLFDLPDLGRRLRQWFATLPTQRILLVPGGGPAADLVRQADALEKLGEERSHWLALRALTFNAHLLAARHSGGVVIQNLTDRDSAWTHGQTPILDMHAFAVDDEFRPDHLAHLWTFASDAFAARVAIVAEISRLILLKSCEGPADDNWSAAAAAGKVDEGFSGVIASSKSPMQISVVNLRQWLSADASAAIPRNPAP